jgi:bleomycin hydrolase
MKKQIFSLTFAFSFFGCLNAQTQTNHVESKYKFEPIVTQEATPVLNQGMSGTCWSFSALSFFESEILRLRKEQIVLSEMFIVRHAYFEKAVKFII